ncbi:hypothetical protein [Proteus mirabilis]|uniref:hypothetical protein n=1 Tax=Proteus mirabilis TaxID=584 RepID=UPI0034D67F10
MGIDSKLLKPMEIRKFFDSNLFFLARPRNTLDCAHFISSQLRDEFKRITNSSFVILFVLVLLNVYSGVYGWISFPFHCILTIFTIHILFRTFIIHDKISKILKSGLRNDSTFGGKRFNVDYTRPVKIVLGVNGSTVRTVIWVPIKSNASKYNKEKFFFDVRCKNEKDIKQTLRLIRLAFTKIDS